MFSFLSYLSPGAVDDIWWLYLIPAVTLSVTVALIILIKRNSDRAIKNRKEKENRKKTEKE